MDKLLDTYRHFLPPEVRGLPWRTHPQDGKLLLFERDTGMNALLEGDETAHLRRVAPRTLLVAITNACNLTCDFCYRDLENRSLWRYDTLMEFCQAADEWGVLEVACLKGDTPVFGPNGMVEVQNLKVGDCLYDSQGVPRQVVKVTTSEKECITLKGNKGWRVTCTPDHPFLVSGSIVEAIDTLGRKLDQNSSLKIANPVTNISLLPYLLKPTPRSSVMHGGQTGGKVEGNLCKITSRSAWVPHTIDLNPEVMWLYGLSVAEGSKRGLALHLSEHDFAERAVSIYGSITNGLSGTIRQYAPGHNSLTVEFQHSKIYRSIFFDAMEIGYLAHAKSIRFLFKVDDELVKAALRGMFDGDGCYRTKSNGKFTDYVLSYKTASKTLANELVYLLYARFGVYASIYAGENGSRKIGTRELPITPYYQVEVFGKHNIQKLFPNLFIDDENFQQIGTSIYSSNKNKDFIEVKEILATGIETVYDVTLENASSHIFTLQHGVLSHNCGGGEPMLFPRWAEFINELYDSTHLCINFTTNGMLLTEDFLRQIAGKYGNIRVSLYEDNHWQQTIKLLVGCGARFGVNWLITPAELPGIEEKFTRLLALGVRDFLLLGYKGRDPKMHLTGDYMTRFSAFVNKAHPALGGAIQLKLDVCWGDSLPDVPRLFTEPDCGAGDDFLSITSDKHVKACSFQGTQTGLPFDTIADLRAIWESRRKAQQAAHIGGCARLPDRGLSQGGSPHALIPLAAIQ